MRQAWQMWQSSLSADQCDFFIDRCRKIDPVEGATFNNDSDHRKSSVRWVLKDDEIHDALWWHVSESNRYAFGFDVTESCSIQFTEYSAESGDKYDWHHDVDWTSPHAFDRKLSVVIQLSDPKYYEGADFQFLEVENPQSEALRAKGTVLVFPSYLQHRVTSITKGTRYSLVAWFDGPRWR